MSQDKPIPRVGDIVRLKTFEVIDVEVMDEAFEVGHSNESFWVGFDKIDEIVSRPLTDAEKIERVEAENAKLKKALEFYALDHTDPSEGPWGIASTDFGSVARAVLEHLKSTNLLTNTEKSES
jgi:hypothetical protein